MLWYYADGDRQVGPVDDEGFKRLLDEGVVQGETLVWHEGLAEWQSWTSLSAAELPAAQGDGQERCAECGRLYSADQLIRYGDSQVCANCKESYFQKIREGVATAGVFTYGGFWIRALALLLDGLILGVVNYLLGLLIPNVSDPSNIGFVVAVAGVGMLLQTTLSALYNTLFVGRYGATPGKMACGLRIVMPDGGRVSYARALGRFFAEMVTGFTMGIGYIIAAFDDEKRTLHDHICNTRVVRN